MIKVSDTAKKKVVALMIDEGFDATKDFVRVGVKSGGCSGLSYDLTFDNKKEENCIREELMGDLNKEQQESKYRLLFRQQCQYI